jgi:type 1 glutamine amidotransferase
MARIALALLLMLAAVAQPRLPKVLYLTQSAGFKHAVLPLSEEILPQIGAAAHAFEVTIAHDSAAITADNLQAYDAVVFYTTGELPMSDAQKRALIDFVRGGKGFVGIHSATDTFYKWPEYGALVGGYFNDHPWHQDVRIRVEDAAHPATRHLPASFTVNDEIYQFRDWSRADVHVLLSLDPSSVDLTKPNVKRTDKDFALAWTKTIGKGRMFYTALGHEPALWRDERFQRHLLGGIRWAMGRN